MMVFCVVCLTMYTDYMQVLDIFFYGQATYNELCSVVPPVLLLSVHFKVKSRFWYSNIISLNDKYIYEL